MASFPAELTSRIGNYCLKSVLSTSTQTESLKDFLSNEATSLDQRELCEEPGGINSEMNLGLGPQLRAERLPGVPRQGPSPVPSTAERGDQTSMEKQGVQNGHSDTQENTVKGEEGKRVDVRIRKALSPLLSRLHLVS